MADERESNAERLARMKRALRAGRENRNNDLNEMDRTLRHGMELADDRMMTPAMNPTEKWRQALEEASARGMVSRRTSGDFGKELDPEANHVEVIPAHDKRPSVRAQREAKTKDRDKDGGMSR